MSRQLAECPYCQGSEITLNDNLDVAFQSAAGPQPCPHLIWVTGRYSEWGLNTLPGRKTKIARIIGSNEFEWQHPSLIAEDPHQLRAYLKELTSAGKGWQFAPSEEHTLRIISAEEKFTDKDGRTYPSWEAEGAAIFTGSPEVFLAALPGCVERWCSTWTDLESSSLL
jgi:hypothetical protein